LKTIEAGKNVLVAGLVLFRQHPQTAKETIFVTIEDETGAANLIVWKHVHEKYHAAVYHGKLLACQGVVQREGQVLHVVARYVWDWSAQLKDLDPQQAAPALPVRSRDFR
jgi:error-prone DNA polymerase